MAIGLDASRFDQHVSVQALEWEHSVYNRLFRSDELRDLLKWQLKNTGFARANDGMIKYTVEGGRMSGDMNTALGNCLIMCAMVWSYMQTKLGPTGKPIHFEFIDNGDDVVLFLEKRDLHRIEDLAEWFGEMGFEMKIEEPVYEIEEIEFCQMHPIEVEPGVYTMVRTYPNAIAKDCICMNPQNFRQWLYAVGECGLAITSGVPVYEAFYQAFKAKGKKGHAESSVHLQDSGFFRLSALGGKKRSSI